MKSVLLVIATLLLTACVPAGPRWNWTQAGMGEKERDAAIAECRHLTHGEGQIPFVAYPSGAEFYQEREGLFNRCMQDRGWEAEGR